MKNPKHVFLLLIIVGLALYTLSLPAGFIFDDHFVLLNNPALGDLRNIPFIWRVFPTRFLPGLSFAVNYAVSGFDPVSFRMVNVACHLVASMLVYLFAKLILSTPYFHNRPIAQAKNTVALFASLIFLVHPVQVESVVYITQRWTLMGTLFYLLSLVCYLRYRLTNQRLFFAGSLLAAILGMLCKEMVFTLPVAIILCELFFFSPKVKDILKSRQRWMPFLCTMGLIPLLLFLEGPYSVLKVSTIISANSLDFLRFLTEINILRTYLRLFILPVSQNLDYDYPLAQGIFEPSIIFSIGLLITLLILIKVFYHQRRLISFCIIWFFLTVSIPAMSCAFQNQEGLMFEHYLYLPMAGFAIFLPYILFEFFKNKKRITRGLEGLIIIFSLLTVHRNYIWADTERLIQDTMAKSPRKTRPLYMSVQYDLQKREYAKAQQGLLKAFDIDPGNVRSDYNLGVIYEAQGKTDEAIRQYEKAVQTDFAIIRAHAYFNLGYLYANKEDLLRAEFAYWECLLSDPRVFNAYSNLGNIYMVQGKFPQAVMMFNKLLAINPLHRDGRNGLASAYVMTGQYDKGIKEYLTNIDFYPEDTAAHKNLAKAYFLKKEYMRAESFFQKALTLNQEDPEAYQYLARIYSALNRKQEAQDNLKTAIGLLEMQGNKDAAKGLEKQYHQLIH